MIKYISWLVVVFFCNITPSHAQYADLIFDFKTELNPSTSTRLVSAGDYYRYQIVDSGTYGSQVRIFVPPGTVQIASNILVVSPVKAIWRWATQPTTSIATVSGEKLLPYGTSLITALLAGQDVVFSTNNPGMLPFDTGSGGLVSPLQTGAYAYINLAYSSSPTFTSTLIVNKACYDKWYSSASTKWVNGNPAENATHTCEGSSGGGSSDMTPPAFKSATTNADGSTITLTYDEELKVDTSLPTTAFGVTVGDTTLSVSSAKTSGATVVLTLASKIQYGQAVKVKYTIPTDSNSRLQDSAGNHVIDAAEKNVTNNVPESVGILYPVSDPNNPLKVLLKWRKAKGDSNFEDLPLLGNFPQYPDPAKTETKDNSFVCVEQVNALVNFDQAADTLTLKSGSNQDEVLVRVTCYVSKGVKQVSETIRQTPPIRIRPNRASWAVVEPTADNPIFDDRTGDNAKFSVYVPSNGSNGVRVVVMLYVPSNATGTAEPYRNLWGMLQSPKNFVIYDEQNENELVYQTVSAAVPSRVIEVDTGFQRSDLKNLQVRAQIFYRGAQWWQQLTNDTTQWDSTK